MKHLLLATAMVPTAATAQQAPPERAIRVTGVGVVRTMPDVARLEYWLRGEGATPDAASAALAARQKAVADAMASVLGRDAELATANVTVIEARDRACDDNRGYNSQPRMSQGPCAVTGHIATMQIRLRTAAVAQAGTAAGLAARLGASDARVTGFELSVPRDAQRRATVAALADARARAEAVAAGTGARLGTLLTVNDQSGGGSVDYVAGANAMAAPPPPPPVQMAAPIAIDVKPAPIETRQQVFVAYAIDG